MYVVPVETANTDSSSSVPTVTVTRRADDLMALLRALEHRLSGRPAPDVEAIGNAYRVLCEWTRQHSEDCDLTQVLAYLEHEGMYPEWRRQALEDAYILLYEDVLRSGEKDALDKLPEPPLGHTAQGATRTSRRGVPSSSEAEHSFEKGNRFWRSQHWRYEIRESCVGAEVGATPKSSTTPRDIVSKGSSARYCACATDPLTDILSSLQFRKEDGEPESQGATEWMRTTPKNGPTSTIEISSPKELQEPRAVAWRR